MYWVLVFLRTGINVLWGPSISETCMSSLLRNAIIYHQHPTLENQYCTYSVVGLYSANNCLPHPSYLSHMPSTSDYRYIISLFRFTERAPRSWDTNPAQKDFDLISVCKQSHTGDDHHLTGQWHTNEWYWSASLWGSWTASNVHVARWGWSSWYGDAYPQTGFY